MVSQWMEEKSLSTGNCWYFPCWRAWTWRLRNDLINVPNNNHRIDDGAWVLRHSTIEVLSCRYYLCSSYQLPAAGDLQLPNKAPKLIGTVLGPFLQIVINPRLNCIRSFNTNMRWVRHGLRHQEYTNIYIKPNDDISSAKPLKVDRIRIRVSFYFKSQRKVTPPPCPLPSWRPSLARSWYPRSY